MKILAIGCSFTFGFELPDAITGPNVFLSDESRPSSLAYPALLAKKYNGSVTNLSMPGGSNGRIFRLTVTEVCRTNYDLVICGWTDLMRVDFTYQSKDIPHNRFATDMFPWLKQYYADHHDWLHQWQIWFTQLLTLQDYFKYHKQKYVFLSMMNPLMSDFPELSCIKEKIDSTHYLGWPNQGMVDFMGDCPKGPFDHPLELGHKRIADKIDEHIRNLGWVS